MPTDRIEEETTGNRLLDRFRKQWFPPAAVVGAFSAFVAAAFPVRPEPKAVLSRSKSPDTTDTLVQLSAAAPPATTLAREYARAAFLAQAFRRSLSGIAIGAQDKVLALGDGKVTYFDSTGALLHEWRVSEKAACLTVVPDGRICVGAADQVQIFDAAGAQVGSVVVGAMGRPASITAIKVFKGELLVADAAARLIRRFDFSGNRLGIIGDRSKAGSFILPNRSLDIAVDAKGVIHATDSGRHQVTAWALDGSPRGAFGRFGMSNPEDFVGCCNPVNLALTPDGKIVTAEKMIARIKVFEPDGRLLALIGPEHFDPNCTQIHLAVDSRGRIIAADPVRREIKVFSQAASPGQPGPLPRSVNAHE